VQSIESPSELGLERKRLGKGSDGMSRPD